MDQAIQDANLSKLSLVCAAALTPISLYVILRLRRELKTDRRVTALAITCVIAILNLNLWYFATWSLWDMQLPVVDQQASALNDAIYDLQYSKFPVAGYAWGNHNRSSSDSGNTCDAISISNRSPVEASQALNLNSDEDIPRIRSQLREMSTSNAVYQLFFQAGKDETEANILRNKWFKFCGSAVWMSQHQVYFMVNRIIYAKSGRRSSPTISVLYAQVFNSEWQQLYDYKFPQSELNFPTILPHEIDVGERKEKAFIGSEDPRVILNQYHNVSNHLVQEPVIVFSARSSETNWSRAMHVYQPLRNPHKITRLYIRNKKRSFIEKNWAPFIDHHVEAPDIDADWGNLGENKINFIYNFSPLRIIKCDVTSGECNRISGPDFNRENANDNAGNLRGGTNIVAVPREYIPQTETTQGRKYWFGVARSHINDCGCVNELYRPHFFIMSCPSTSSSSSQAPFRLDYISSLVDFNVNPETWSTEQGKSTCGDGKSVLIPNSIAYWGRRTTSGNSSGGGATREEDYMGITFSEADRTNKLIHVRGLLNYVHQILSGPVGERDDDDDDDGDGGRDETKEEIDEWNNVLGKCSTFDSSEYCKLAQEYLDWEKN
ncbi:uncharacterized protein LODBEIA_P05990 [Lodderomyces beijingensis]|uniref:Uncharacterized protein n=1 Tax=Lodderomyces beijingensis TaxID=1775926 RepID=A0ABP0ZJ67_9ASCO